MSTLTIPNSFTTNTLIESAKVNANFTAIATLINTTGLTNENITVAAAIALNKLAATTASRALVSDSSGFITAATTTSTEIGYVNGVTSAIQTQINTKAPSASPTFTGTVTTPVTASRALATGSSSELVASSTTATELGYVNGVTSAIQTQLNTKAPTASPTFSGTITTALTASRALTTGSSSELAVSSTTSTELGYVNGVTSAIQTQINTKSPSDSPTFTGTVTTPVTASRALVTGSSSELAASSVTSTELGYVSGVTSAIQTQLNSLTASAQSASDDIKNLGISCSVASNALTIALKQADGSTNPSTGSAAVSIGFRSTTATAGSYAVQTATGALSLVISSGSTLGHTSAQASYIYVYALDNSGTIELACSSTPVDETQLQSTTAEGGAGGADSATVLYSTTARTSKAVRLIARLLSSQTTAGTWAAVPTNVQLIGRKAINPTIQQFTSGTGTYTTPAGVRYLRVRLVGGGGGGGGAGTNGGGSTAGGTGGNTTFGTSLLSGSGGVGGTAGNAGPGDGGAGGAASLGTGPIGFAFQGGYGTDGTGCSTASVAATGGCGCSSPFGGAGGGGVISAGTAGVSNTGSGGGGGGPASALNSGAGGGSGGYVDAIIPAPVLGTYAYAVGAAGTAGSTGTSGNAGGAGGSGYIIVEEHYY